MIFSGPSYRTICQADGRWSHPVPRCYGELDLGPVGPGKTNKKDWNIFIILEIFQLLDGGPA